MILLISFQVSKNSKKTLKKRSLHMQATPDDGPWKVRKRSG